MIAPGGRGKEQKIRFVQDWLWPDLCHNYWCIDHIKLHDSVVRPATLVGMEFTGNGIPGEPLSIFPGPLYA